MRIEVYVREMKCYNIAGLWGINPDGCVEVPNPQPIKMEAFCYSWDKPMTDTEWKNTLAPTVGSDVFGDKDGDCFGDKGKFFSENFLKIMKGEVRGWELGSFEITPTAIILDYTFPGNDSDYGLTLWVCPVDEGLRFRFTAPRNSYGFNPTYDVCRMPYGMRVEENLGYMKRELVFELKEPSDQENILQRDNQIVTITECRDI